MGQIPLPEVSVAPDRNQRDVHTGDFIRPSDTQTFFLEDSPSIQVLRSSAATNRACTAYYPMTCPGTYRVRHTPEGEIDISLATEDQENLAHTMDGLTPSTLFNICIVPSRTDKACTLTLAVLGSGDWVEAHVFKDRAPEIRDKSVKAQWLQCSYDPTELRARGVSQTRATELRFRQSTPEDG